MIDFLHVGMPKAASTWLQEVWFAQHPRLAVLGTRAGAGELHHRFRQEVRRLVRGGDLYADVSAFARTIEDLARQWRAQRRAAGFAADVVGLSSEILAGDWPTGRNTRFLANALARCWPRAKIVFVVREHRRLLESSHQEYVRQGGCQRLGAFVFGPCVSRGMRHDEETRSTDVVEYCMLAPKAQLYRECFGADRVHVTCMERLAADPPGFAGALAGFLGIEPLQPAAQRTNAQLSPFALALLRPLNRMFSTDHHRRYGPMPVNALLTAVFARRGSSLGAFADNPWWRRHMVSAYAQRQLAERWLPPLDRALLRHLPAPRQTFARLPVAAREFLEDRFRSDSAALQPFVDFDLGQYRYLSERPRAGSSP